MMVVALYVHVPYRNQLVKLLPIIGYCLPKEEVPITPGDVKNVYGKRIVIQETMESHFLALQKMWK